MCALYDNILITTTKMPIVCKKKKWARDTKMRSEIRYNIISCYGNNILSNGRLLSRTGGGRPSHHVLLSKVNSNILTSYCVGRYKKPKQKSKIVFDILPSTKFSLFPVERMRLLRFTSKFFTLIRFGRSINLRLRLIYTARLNNS